jgi:hypothetical protein
MTKKTKQLGISIDEYLHNQLLKDSTANGITITEQAREVLRRWYQNNELVENVRAELKDQLREDLQAEFEGLRSELRATEISRGLSRINNLVTRVYIASTEGFRQINPTKFQDLLVAIDTEFKRLTAPAAQS